LNKEINLCYWLPFINNGVSENVTVLLYITCSQRADRTAEMVMLERMFLASEKEVLAEEKRKAEQDPGMFPRSLEL